MKVNHDHYHHHHHHQENLDRNIINIKMIDIYKYCCNLEFRKKKHVVKMEGWIFINIQTKRFW